MNYTLFKKAMLAKRADGGVANDRFGSAVGDSIGGAIGVPTGVLGTLIGVARGKPSEDELEAMDASPGLSYFPGVGAYRLARKNLDTVANDRPRTTLIADSVGPLTSAAAPALLGAALLGAISGEATGALAGGIIGGGTALAASGIGALIGSLRKRRTEAEQAEADENHSLAKSLLVPGVAAYNTARRNTSLTRREDERNRKAEKA